MPPERPMAAQDARLPVASFAHVGNMLSGLVLVVVVDTVVPAVKVSANPVHRYKIVWCCILQV